MPSQPNPQTGVAIQAFTASDFVDQVRQAEDLGLSTAWTTIGGAGGADPLTVAAAALTATARIRVGTAIVPTWPRHPLALASQALALHRSRPAGCAWASARPTSR